MIKDIILGSVYSSSGEKTIKAVIKTDKGSFYGCAPSGASTGKKEALYKPIPYLLKIFPKLKKKLIGLSEKKVDNILGKIGVNKLGANLTVSLSIAAAKASTNDNFHGFKRRFPIPLGVVICGGKHADKRGIQEFLVFYNRAKTIGEAIGINKKIHKKVGDYLRSQKLLVGKGLEGGWISKSDDIKSLKIIREIASKYNAEIGLDMAASELWNGKNYCYEKEKLTPYEQLVFVLDLIKSFRLKYVEDPFHEDDFENHAALTNNIGDLKNLTKVAKIQKTKCLICGDDLFVTNPSILWKGIRKKACNSIIIKPNQVGTVSLALKTIALAKKHGYKHIVSHRGGETLDPFISDLAVRTGACLIKCGIFGKERVAKLKRLEEIWNMVGNAKMEKI